MSRKSPSGGTISPASVEFTSNLTEPFLKTQQTLFEVIQQLLQSVELELTPPDAASITPTEPDSAPVEWARSMDVMSVTSIGEFPDDWGDPQEWVEAPRGRVFRRRANRTQARADRRPA